jgi:hypothetical protein
MITVPLTAIDVRTAAQVGIARALEALEESCEKSCEPQLSFSWDRVINAAIMDYALGTLKDRYWPGPRPDPYHPHEFDPDPPLANACDLGANSEPLADSGTRIRMPSRTDPPVLVVEVELNCVMRCCPVEGCTEASAGNSPASRESLEAEGDLAVEQSEERDARLFRKWIDISNSRIYYWPGFAWGRAVLTGPA